MENSTIISLLTTTVEGNISSPENQQKVRETTVEWIVAQCISAVVTALALYLVVALTCFELKKRGYSFGKNLESQPGKTTNSSAEYSPTKSSEGMHQKQSGGFKIRKRNTGNHEDRYENWLRMMSLSAATFALWKCLSLQMDMFWGTTTIALCTVFTYFTVSFNGMSLISVYLLLWLRQWAVHSHPALQHLPVKRLRRISWLLLGLMIVTFIALCLFFYITIQWVLHNSLNECKHYGKYFNGIYYPKISFSKKQENRFKLLYLLRRLTLILNNLNDKICLGFKWPLLPKRIFDNLVTNDKGNCDITRVAIQHDIDCYYRGYSILLTYF